MAEIVADEFLQHFVPHRNVSFGPYAALKADTCLGGRLPGPKKNFAGALDSANLIVYFCIKSAVGLRAEDGGLDSAATSHERRAEFKKLLWISRGLE